MSYQTSSKKTPNRPQAEPTTTKKTIRQNVFRLLFLSMVAFGIIVGAIFPLFVKIYFNDGHTIPISFPLMCMAAGITVGVVNYVLFALVISKQLRFLVRGMDRVNSQINDAMFSKQAFPGNHEIEVKTDDIIGKVTQAFNTMSNTVGQRFAHEANFRDITSNLSGNVDLDKTCNIILNYFIDTTCITSGLLYGKIDEEMILLANHNLDTDASKLPRKLESWQGIISDTIKSGEIHTIDNDPNYFEWISITTPLGTLRPKLIHIIPLIADKSTVGLVVACCGPNDIPENILMKTLESYARAMAPYLQNSLLHNKIKEMASYDSLTHVLNRRFGLIRLEEEFSAALRHRLDLSVIILDIDKFKRVNDTFGHQAGDKVLKSIASTIALNLRSAETICRYGGEEFLIILPMADLDKAGLVAERLRGIIEQLSFYHKDNLILNTISLGVASFTSLETRNKNDLINMADTALYHAKNMGRNRVALFRKNESVLLPRNP